MREQDREIIDRLVEGQKAAGDLMTMLANDIERLSFDKLVLTAACGALFAELAGVSGQETALDAMLSRFTAVIESNPDAKGHVLQTTDEIRKFAESIAGN